jgi:hypothetical protein
MENDPRFIPDPEPKEKAKWCPYCERMETKERVIYWPEKAFRDRFDVTIELCDICKSENVKI